MKIVKYQILATALLMLFANYSGAESKRVWSKSVTTLAALRADWTETSEPFYFSGTLYASSIRGDVVAINSDSGAIRWRKKFKDPVSSVTADEKGVYFAVGDGTFRALAADNGAERWKMEIRSSIISTPVAANGIVYFVCGDDTLYAVDAEKGEWKWQFNYGLKKEITILGAPKPLIYNGKVVVGMSDGLVVAIDAISGKLVWGRRIGEELRFMDMDASPTVAEGLVFAASYEGGIFALDVETGETVWKTGGGSIKPMAAIDGLLILTDNDGKLKALVAKNGEAAWDYECPGGGKASGVAIVSGKIIFADTLGHIHVVDPKNGVETQRLHTWGGVHMTPVTSESKVFLTNGRGTIYSYIIE